MTDNNTTDDTTSPIYKQRVARRSKETDESHRPTTQEVTTQMNVAADSIPPRKTKQKVPIMVTATAVLAQGTNLLTTGDVLTGGLLMVIGVGLVGLYEAYQVKELPDPVDADMIEQASETIADRVYEKMNK